MFVRTFPWVTEPPFGGYEGIQYQMRCGDAVARALAKRGSSVVTGVRGETLLSDLDGSQQVINLKRRVNP